MTRIIENIGVWGLGIVLLGVGFWLVWRSVLDIGSALGGKNKEWGKALIGLGIGILGGFLIIVGATRILSIFKTNGQEIPL